MESPVIFENRNSLKLFGILHSPENIGKIRVGINILNPGLKNRVAPNRLNVKLARLLCQAGFFVLRVDPFGIGDSEGELFAGNADNLDLWRMIQEGGFVSDTITSNSWFTEKLNLDKLIIIGQCGAGVTALLSGAKDKRIEQLVLIDTPFRFVPSALNMERAKIEYSSKKDLLKRGFKSVFSGRKLGTLLKGDFDWSPYLDVLRQTVKNLSRGTCLTKRVVNERFNWEMLKAFRTVMKRRAKIQFIYAENDFSLKEFREDVEKVFLKEKEDYRAICEFRVVRDANHIYTETLWQKELTESILEWVERTRMS